MSQPANPNDDHRKAPSTAATSPSTRSDDHRLHGTWVARDVDSKLGDVKVRLTFKREGPVKIAAWSDLPLVGQVRDKTAPYDIHGNTISSQAIRGGTSVKYRFTDTSQLVVEYEDGKTVTFTRQ